MIASFPEVGTFPSDRCLPVEAPLWARVRSGGEGGGHRSAAMSPC